MNPIVSEITIILALSGFILAIITYRHQKKFQRIQNLSLIWRKFIDVPELLNLFTICDEIAIGNKSKIPELSSFSYQTKLRFLGLLEEVSLYSLNSQVEFSEAAYLFQWHFNFAYGDEEIAKAFWKNIGGFEESEKDYWKRSKDFSRKCSISKS